MARIQISQTDAEAVNIVVRNGATREHSELKPGRVVPGAHDHAPFSDQPHHKAKFTSAEFCASFA